MEANLLNLLLFLPLLIGAGLCQDSELINYRLDCVLTENDISEQECKNRACHWDAASPTAQYPAIPRCYLDPKQVGYTGAAVARAAGFDANLTLKTTAKQSIPNLELIPQLKLSVSYYSDNILRIRITDAQNKRFEVPLEHFLFNIPKSQPNTAPNNPAYEVSLKEDFNLVVTRTATGSKLIDTSIGGLIYSDQFIQFASFLPSADVYGFGENQHRTLRRNLTYVTIPIFPRDHIGVHNELENLYGQHPFFTSIEKDGKAFGVFLLNASPLSYTLLPAPAVSLKAAGGILDLFIFVGDNPKHVIQLYTSIVGRSILPSFWALGNQQSRWGYANTQVLRKVITRNIEKGVPLDVMYIDSDYKDGNREFVVKPAFHDLNALIGEFRSKHHIRWTPIIDPCVTGTGPANYMPWIEGHRVDAFVNWPAEYQNDSAVHVDPNLPDKKIFYGHLWPAGPVAFVDFFKSSGRKYFKDMLTLLHRDFHFDGLWDDMNEPSFSRVDHCPQDKYNLIRPRQGFHGHISDNTMCMSTVQGDQQQYRHYDVHSLYGLSEMKSTQEALHEITGKRGFILSRNTFPSSGQFTAHWLGDTDAKWEVMRWTLIGMMEFNMFGISLVGVDVCGFFGVPTPELCKRWMQLGAYYPLSRNHQNSGQPDHDPAIYAETGHPEVTTAAVRAYTTRYQLLHYLYTKFYQAYALGDTVMRPLAFQFPSDHEVRGIYEQFLLGPAVMVNPFLYPNQTKVSAFLPNNTSWYRFGKTRFVERAEPVSGHIEFDDSESSRPLLFQSGSILPFIHQTELPSEINTATIREQSQLELWILPNSSGSAYGDLFFDDGETIDTVGKGLFNYYEFKLEKCEIEINVKSAGYRAPADSKDILQLKSINVALWSALTVALPVNVTINGADNRVHIGNVTLLSNELYLGFAQPFDLLQLKKDQKVQINIGNGTDCFTN